MSSFSLSGPQFLLIVAVGFIGLLAVTVLVANLTGYLQMTATTAKLRRSVSLAVKSLWLHKLRSFLSVLGIIIGTCSVISLMSFGEGSMQDALDDIKRQGATNIIIRSVKPPDESSTSSKGFVTTYGLTRDDLDQFTTFGDMVGQMVPMRVFPTETRYLERIINARVIATVPDYQIVNKLQMSRGRFLTDDDDTELDNYCVLGSEAADKLFPYEDPVGHSVGMRGHFFRVIGVVTERMPTGGSGGSQAAEDYNKDVYIPIRVSRRPVRGSHLHPHGRRAHEREGRVQPGHAHRERGSGHPGGAGEGSSHWQRDQGDVVEAAPQERLGGDRAARQAGGSRAGAGAVHHVDGDHCLYLDVRGRYRHHEHHACHRDRTYPRNRYPPRSGAKQKDIVMQFLVEAVVQTTIGGLVGAAIGILSVYTVPFVWDVIRGWSWFASETRLPAKLHVMSIFLSVGVSILVGMVFGLYPAWRAAKLDPIEALRHE